jgi:hypothetical protein
MRTLLQKQHKDFVHNKQQPTDYKNRHMYDLHLISHAELDMNTIPRTVKDMSLTSVFTYNQIKLGNYFAQ